MNFSSVAAVNPLYYCYEILPFVSRTFAIGINALSGDLKKSVLVGYLLCRIADTIEDANNRTAEQKVADLKRFLSCFQASFENIQQFSQVAALLEGEKGHLDLVKNTEKVFAVYQTLSQDSKQSLERWVVEMVTGMIDFIQKYPSGIRIRTLQEYQKYCYYVAGTVGFLLSELWKEYSSFIDEKTFFQMQKHASAFGEALQTVNILKDISWDFHHENSIYIPLENLEKIGNNHENMFAPAHRERSEHVAQELLALAAQDLQKAQEYILLLPKFSPRIRYFCILPLILAYATLRELQKAPSLLTPHSPVKISRFEVKRLVFASGAASFSNTYLKNLIEKVQISS